MTGIDTHLKTIKDGVFGRDVRQAIHDGIEQVYKDATENGNANMEVAKARGEFENLALHLQAIQSGADAANQRAQSLDASKLDKKGIEQISYEMLTQDVKQKMTGGSVAVVGANAVSTSNIVNGSVTDQKLDERMGFGVILSGKLLIDATNSKVVMDQGTYYQVGKRRNAPSKRLECPFVMNKSVSQYVVYNDQTNTISIYTLADIPNIGNRDTILAITYSDTLIYPQFSRFIETRGIAIGERTHFVNGSWGTLIQGFIRHNPFTQELEMEKENGSFIVAYKGVYYMVPEVSNYRITTGAGLVIYLNTDSKAVEVLPMDNVVTVNKTAIPSSANRIKLAEFYLRRLHHVSNDKNIFKIGDVRENSTLERLRIDLQTRPTTIVCFGDSTTDGYRTTGFVGNELGSLADKPKSYPAILQGLLRTETGHQHSVLNRGFSGKTIEWLDENLDAVMVPVSSNVDYATISLGINGLVYTAAKLESFRKSYKSVIAKLRARGIEPIMMTTQSEFENATRFGERIHSVTDTEIKAIATELGAPLIDYNQGTSTILNASDYGIRALIPDMCHFGDLGHQKGAEYLASELIPRAVVNPTKIGYQSNCVKSGLAYSDFLSDTQKEVKWISRTDGFDLEGQLNSAEHKTMFDTLVYIERPMAVSYFGDNVTVTSNGQNLASNSTLDVGLYKIVAQNQPGTLSRFRGLKFISKEN